MGIGCSCFRLSSSSSKTSPEELNDHSEESFLTNKHMNNTITISEKEKRQFVFEEEEEEADDDHKKQFKTLKDCLLDSPAVNGYYISNALHNHFVKQNKVHPSLLGDDHDRSDYGYDNNSRGSFSKQRLVRICEPALRKSRCKKAKKRVSFRFPEEADIFVYNLTEEDDN